jgi:hypothetical protein
MPEPLAGRPALVAGEVKGRLLKALAPAWGATLAGLEAQPELAEREDILVLLQLVPERLRIVSEGHKPDRPAQELVSGTFAQLCDDRGEKLRDAILAYLAGTLRAFGNDEAEDRIMRYAEALEGKGGFLLVVRPWTGETRLFMAKAGEDLSAALDVGGIGEQVTLH